MDCFEEFARRGFRWKLIGFADLPTGARMDGRFGCALWKTGMEEPISFMSDKNIDVALEEALEWAKSEVGY